MLKRRAASSITPSKKARTYNRATASKKKTYIIPNAPGLLRVPRPYAMPLRLRNTMRYSDTISITLSTGDGFHYFSCNGLYDPDISGSGHQPLYFDQLMAMYDQYVVVASKITVTPVVSSVSLLCGVSIEDDTTSNLFNLEVEKGTSKYRAYGPISAGGSPQIGVTQFWNQAKTFGQGAMMGAQLSGTSAANPTEQSYFHITLKDPGAGSVTVHLQVLVEYTTDWIELKTMTGS